MDLIKKCTECSIEKPIDLFYKHKNGKYGVMSNCKDCIKKRTSEWINDNPDKRKKIANRWAKKTYHNLSIEEKKNINEKRRKENIKKRENATPEEKHKIYLKRKKRREVNSDKNKEYKRNWYLRNKEHAMKKSKDWYFNNHEKAKESGRKSSKKYRKLNPNKVRESNKKSHKKRFDNDFIFKLSTKIRSLINKTFKNLKLSKNTKTIDILGCTFGEFKAHLESKFEPWMTWENRGLYNGELNYGWDIDHIIPISLAKTEEDLIKLNHYTNLQPLCSYTNRHIKRDNV